MVRGVQFDLDLIYEVEDAETMKRDFAIIRDGLRLLKYDYLGGSGSRGYGKVKFLDLYAEPVIGEVDEDIMDECNALLQEI